MKLTLVKTKTETYWSLNDKVRSEDLASTPYSVLPFETTRYVPCIPQDKVSLLDIQLHKREPILYVTVVHTFKDQAFYHTTNLANENSVMSVTHFGIVVRAVQPNSYITEQRHHTKRTFELAMKCCEGLAVLSDNNDFLIHEGDSPRYIVDTFVIGALESCFAQVVVDCHTGNYWKTGIIKGSPRELTDDSFQIKHKKVSKAQLKPILRGATVEHMTLESAISGLEWGLYKRVVSMLIPEENKDLLLTAVLGPQMEIK
jgi:hypothetical protein